MMRTLLVVILVLLVVVVGGVMLWSGDDGRADMSRDSRTITERFTHELRSQVIDELGQPIEGFEPFMFLEVFPGLEASDFDGVDALIGGYRVEDGEVVYDLMGEEELHSAARAISDEGMKTLLSNAANRLDIDLDADGAFASLIEALSAGEVEIFERTARLDETVSALGASITVLEVLEDSRCPVDVTCIQAGTVRIQVRIESGLGESVMEMTLNEPITTEAEEITLLEVLPEQRFESSDESDEYQFVFEIKRR